MTIRIRDWFLLGVVFSLAIAMDACLRPAFAQAPPPVVVGPSCPAGVPGYAGPAGYAAESTDALWSTFDDLVKNFALTFDAAELETIRQQIDQVLGLLIDRTRKEATVSDPNLLSYRNVQHQYDELNRKFWATRDLKQMEKLNAQATEIGEILTGRNIQALANRTPEFDGLTDEVFRTLAVENAKSRHKAFWRPRRDFGYHPSRADE